MRRSLLVVLLLLLAVPALVGCVPTPPGVGFARKTVREQHNQKRAKYGVAPLTKSKAANHNAQIAANRISGESGYGGCNLNHTSGFQLIAWYNARVAENIACIVGCIDSGGAFKAFWHSPAHRSNMLDGGFRWIGIGVQCNGPMSFFAIHYIS
ncbi:MAG: CAP domain-containing protein [Acidimicrobiia bacterium]